MPNMPVNNTTTFSQIETAFLAGDGLLDRDQAIRFEDTRGLYTSTSRTSTAKLQAAFGFKGQLTDLSLIHI